MMMILFQQQLLTVSCHKQTTKTSVTSYGVT